MISLSYNTHIFNTSSFGVTTPRIHLSLFVCYRAAALPITFRCMQKNKVDTRISKFVLPIGATVNMDGTALFVTVASIFIAQMNNIELNAGQLATVVLTSTAASIASASVPSAALVLMLIVLTAIDAPYQDVSLLWAIDWFV